MDAVSIATQNMAYVMYVMLQELFADPDAEINGADLVEAIGMCVQGRFGAGISMIDEMIRRQERQED